MRRIFITALCFTAVVNWPGFWSSAVAKASTSDIRGIARVGDKPERNVVVWVDAPGVSREIDSKPMLDQRNFSFYPHVLAVQVGSTVEFPNHDRSFHNVFSFHNGKRFDLGIYPTGTVRRITFDKPGVSMVFCNIHPQMAAYIMAVDSPYFAVSDETGAFTIRGVPSGTLTYHAWRPGGSVITGSATTNAETSLEVRWQ
jgi:plastocyanin